MIRIICPHFCLFILVLFPVILVLPLLVNSHCVYLSLFLAIVKYYFATYCIHVLFNSSQCSLLRVYISLSQQVGSLGVAYLFCVFPRNCIYVCIRFPESVFMYVSCSSPSRCYCVIVSFHTQPVVTLFQVSYWQVGSFFFQSCFPSPIIFTRLFLTFTNYMNGC